MIMTFPRMSSNTRNREIAHVDTDRADSVFVIANGNERGGAATHLMALAEALSASGRPQHYTFALLGDGYLAHQLRCRGCKVQLLPTAQMSAVPALARSLARHPYSLVNAHGPRMNVVAALAAWRANRPWTSTIHSDPRTDFLHSRFKTVFFTRLNRRCLGSADGLFTVNPDYGSLWPNRPLFHLPNAAVLRPLPRERQYYQHWLRERLQLPPDSKLVGIAARFDPNKNIDVLVQAIGHLRHPDVYLLLAGSGPLRDRLEQVARAAGVRERLRFIGFIEWTPEFYAGLDVHVLPSRNEGTGLSILEAGFYGTPNVGSDIGGIRQLIDDGHTGLLAPAGDAKALAGCIQRLLSEDGLAQRLVERFREEVVPRHTPHGLLAAYERGYQELRGRHNWEKTRPSSP
jgi:glycosyltransferase involved in cell wall biosynthesis